jgi:hypothetical protein
VFLGHGGPGHEFADAVCAITIGETGEGFGQPCVRVDGVEFAAFDQRGDHRPVVAALIRAGKQCVFAVEGKRPYRALDRIVVEIDPAIVKKAQ